MTAGFHFLDPEIGESINLVVVVWGEREGATTRRKCHFDQNAAASNHHVQPPLGARSKALRV